MAPIVVTSAAHLHLHLRHYSMSSPGSTSAAACTTPQSTPAWYIAIASSLEIGNLLYGIYCALCASVCPPPCLLLCLSMFMFSPTLACF